MAYNGTSLNGQFPIADTSLTQPLDVVPIEELLIHFLRILPNADTSLLYTANRFFSPTTTWTIQISLDNADASMTPAQDCPALLIDPTPGHYSSTCTKFISLWLALLASV